MQPLGIGPGARSHAQDERPRPQDHLAGRRLDITVGHDHPSRSAPHRPARGAGDGRVRKLGAQGRREGPAGQRWVDLDGRRRAVEPGPGHGGDVADGGEAGEAVEGGEAGAVGGGRHHRLGAEEGGHLPGEDVGAAPVPAGEGHGEPAAVVDHDYGRVGRLVGQPRGDGPHGDPGGADEHEPVDLVPALPHGRHQAAVVVLVGEPPGESRPRPGHRAGDDPFAARPTPAHAGGASPAGGCAGPASGSGPQHTKTGFSAANRRAPLPPRGAPRLTATWTSCPSRLAAAAARSRAA